MTSNLTLLIFFNILIVLRVILKQFLFSFDVAKPVRAGMNYIYQ